MTEKRIVCWIPIDKNGEAILDEIKPGDFDFTSSKKQKLPMSLTDKESLLAVNPITVMKTNHKFCFWIVQGGVLMEK